MKLKHRHIISMSLLLCGLLAFASCINESFDQPCEEEDNSIFLTFHTAVAGASTRAGDEVPADEQIKRLLVVIVSEEPATPEDTEGGTGADATNGTKWVVEHNSIVKGTSTGLPLTDGYTFKVKAGCKKRIYLIANYEGLKDADGNLDFTDEAFIPEENTTRAKVDDYVFALNDEYKYDPETYGIPMTAMYEIAIPDRETIKTDEYELPNPLYVVRTATKFSFKFTNESTLKDITIKGFDLKKIIKDRMYLMPHVNKKDGKYWVVNALRTSPRELDGNGTDKDWIDWMVEEVKKTKDDENIDQYEWLTDYTVPRSQTETEEDRKFSYSFETSISVPKGETEGVSAPSPIYLPESQTTKAINGEDANLLLQEYELTIHTTEKILNDDGKGSAQITNEYTAKLPQLASLFRNTHVKVNVTFKDHQLDWEVDVEPYWEVVLDPIFGLGDKPTN